MLTRGALLSLLAAAAAHAQPAPAPPAAIPPVPSIASLVATLDDDPDLLHNDVTPAVWGLCAHQLAGAAAVVPLLEAAAPMTRLHASRALECAVASWFGFAPGQGYPDGSGAEARFRALWIANGSYGADLPAPARHAARVRWERWLAQHQGTAAPGPDEPSARAVRDALRSGLAAARACGAGPRRVSATVTFRSTGAVRQVRVRGAARAPARCIERALAPARVPPFTRPSSTVAVSISP
ncbi:MAG: hypothetical protein R3B06_24420 [Kofleriaceae bacterium]